MLKEVLGRGENREVTADVVVIGGGPGGSVAAKNCARYGMRTLLLERKKLPRHKMCTGMIMDNLARALIAKEFGAIPDRVLADPPILSGIQWHSSSLRDVEDIQQDAPMSHTWRKELDYWMNQKAKETGAEIWDETLVTDVTEESDGITLKIMRFSKQQEIRARFVVGADGSPSTTRTRLFPSLDVHYYGIYVECHPGALNLDRRYWHVFGRSPAITPRLSYDWFDVIHKGNCFLIEATAVVRHAKEVMPLAKQILVENWGLDPKSKPLWTGGTVGAVLHDEFLSREFLPAKGNILLVGDAAGLAPLGSIGMALKSGLMASSAIIKAVNTSKEAAFIYLIMLQPVREVLKTVTTMAASNQVGSKKLLDKLI